MQEYFGSNALVEIAASRAGRMALNVSESTGNKIRNVLTGRFDDDSGKKVILDIIAQLKMSEREKIELINSINIDVLFYVSVSDIIEHQELSDNIKEALINRRNFSKGAIKSCYWNYIKNQSSGGEMFLRDILVVAGIPLCFTFPIAGIPMVALGGIFGLDIWLNGRSDAKRTSKWLAENENVLKEEDMRYVEEDMQDMRDHIQFLKNKKSRESLEYIKRRTEKEQINIAHCIPYDISVCIKVNDIIESSLPSKVKYLLLSKRSNAVGEIKKATTRMYWKNTGFRNRVFGIALTAIGIAAAAIVGGPIAIGAGVGVALFGAGLFGETFINPRTDAAKESAFENNRTQSRSTRDSNNRQINVEQTLISGRQRVPSYTNAQVQEQVQENEGNRRAFGGSNGRILQSVQASNVWNENNQGSKSRVVMIDESSINLDEWNGVV